MKSKGLHLAGLWVLVGVLGACKSNPLIIYPGEISFSNVGYIEGQSRVVIKGTQGALTFGPYTKDVADGVNLVSFQLEVGERTTASVARLDVTENTRLLASLTLRGTDFYRAREAQEFRLRFKNQAYTNIEFVVNSTGAADLKHNRTVVRPVPHENIAPWAGTYAWDTLNENRNGRNAFLEMTQGTGLALLLDYTLGLPQIPGNHLARYRQAKTEQKVSGVRFILNIDFRDIVRPHGTNTQRDPKSVTEAEIKAFYRDRRSSLGEDNLQDIAAVYLSDEPELVGNDRGYEGFEPWQVDAAVRAANIEFPAIPTFVAYFRDSTWAAKGLDYRGMEFYHRQALDQNHRRSRYNQVRSNLQGAKIVIIPRSFGSDPAANIELMSDAEQARLSRVLLDDIAAEDDVVGSLWFIWGRDGSGENGGLRFMPETRREVFDWSTRRRLGL